MASSTNSTPSVPTTPGTGGATTGATGEGSTLQRGAQAVGEHAGATVETAKGEAGEVLRSATEHARTLLDSAGGELRTQSEAQAERIASSLSGMSDELRHFADDDATSQPLSDVARTLSDATGRVARRLEDGGPDAVIDDVARYGRNHPVKFLAIAAAAGFAAGRILRSSDTDTLRRSVTDGAGIAPGSGDQVGVPAAAPIGRSAEPGAGTVTGGPVITPPPAVATGAVPAASPIPGDPT